MTVPSLLQVSQYHKSAVEAATKTYASVPGSTTAESLSLPHRSGLDRESLRSSSFACKCSGSILRLKDAPDVDSMAPSSMYRGIRQTLIRIRIRVVQRPLFPPWCHQNSNCRQDTWIDEGNSIPWSPSMAVWATFRRPLSRKPKVTKMPSHTRVVVDSWDG